MANSLPMTLRTYRRLSAAVALLAPALIKRRLKQGKEDPARIGERRGVTIDLGELTNSLPGPIYKDQFARLERLAGAIGVPAIAMASAALSL